MSNNNSSPRKKRLPSLATVAHFDIKFAVQAALLNRRPRVYLVDPETNRYAEGLVNQPALLLTYTPPAHGLLPVLKRPFGFIPGPPVVVGTILQPLKIDAILYFTDYPDEEIPSGFDKETGTYSMVIQAWHHEEMAKWRKIAQKVASKFVIEQDNERIPLVYFSITSHIIPHNPEAPTHQVIDRSGSDDDGSTYAVSHIPIPRSYYYDDDE